MRFIADGCLFVGCTQRLGWAGSDSWWGGLDWVKENGPVSISDPQCTHWRLHGLTWLWFSSNYGYLQFIRQQLTVRGLGAVSTAMVTATARE